MAASPVDYDLDALAPGDENILAITAALKVLDEPGEQNNPLFVYGPPSVGKTHLLYGLQRRLQARYPHWSTLALPAGEFLEECEQAWQSNQKLEFRQSLWKIDALLIDDVHTLVNRPAALEELYHAYNRLIADGRQLVMTSRFSPAEMTELSTALRSRFECGLVVGIQPPGERLLRDIIDQKSLVYDVALSPKATGYLVKEVRNVRELLGVLAQLKTMANANGRAKGIGLGEVKEILDQHVAEHMTIADVAKAVCQYFHVELPKVRSASRQQALVQARQMAMYLARELTTAPLTEIGRFFGGRDHTTVLYACRKVGEELRQSTFGSRAAKEIRCLLRQ